MATFYLNEDEDNPLSKQIGNLFGSWYVSVSSWIFRALLSCFQINRKLLDYLRIIWDGIRNVLWPFFHLS